MEPEVKDPESSGHLDTLSGSDGSQELYISESQAESHYDATASDGDYPTDPRPDAEFPECRQSHDWESTSEQESLPEQSGSQEDDAPYRETDSIHLGGSKGSIAESPHISTSETPPSSGSPCPDPKPHTGQVSQAQSASPSSSHGQGDAALALTPARPQGDTRRQGHGAGTGSRWDREIESSGEGGCTETPPAPGCFGIPGKGAEQAEKWDSESDRDLCRPNRHRRRHARLSFIESQAEKQVKENKSKCKRIAQLLTNAPNPQNKGALLFNRRRQRVKKFTFVSYGTRDNESDDEDQRKEESEEHRPVGFNFLTDSDSELEQEYSVYPQEQDLNLNWENPDDMEETTGKGLMMFAQRRQRMDAIGLEYEELRHKGLPVEGTTEPEHTEIQDRPTYEMEETYMQSTEEHVDQTYVDRSVKQDSQYQENVQQMSHLFIVPRPLVPNRTAKPFQGFQSRVPVPFSPLSRVTAPVTKKYELKFKVPVPITTSPQVWSPTGDIIASRDERISVPAIKTGILPERKRRGTNKKPLKPNTSSNPYLENKGERRSYIEPEEDFFSLGAEACNFMQPRTVKLKNPPPVAPKPTINPSCLPWLKKSPSLEPFHSMGSPISTSSPSPVGPQTQQYLHPTQQMSNPWAPVQTQAPLQPSTYASAPVNTSPQAQLQPSINSWSPQPPRSPVSIKALSPTYTPPHPPSASRNKSQNPTDSVASCPPQGSSYIHASKAPPASPRAQASDRGISPAAEGPTLMGKGAELFAKRQSRMEKFVVDAETVQANKIKSPSPSSSLPNSWRYSPNVRAPPPLSYNPLLSPFYPPSAAKQPPSTSPKIKPKTKEKPKAPKKHLNTLDVMKHQPYQLDSSLFKYDAVTEAKSASPKSSPTHTPTPKHSSVPYSHTRDLADQSKSTPIKSSASGLGRSYSLSLPRRLHSMPSLKPLSPVSTPGLQSYAPTQRQTSWQERAYKPPSPWEAASRSPIGSVDDAFTFQGLQSSIASNVRSAAQRRSLPEPPAEWKRRVSLEVPVVNKGYYHAPPAFQTSSLSKTISTQKPTVYGPPFRPAQPLVRPGSRVTVGYMGQGTSPTKQL